MEILINQILTHKEAAALPSLLESGGLPALISGLSAVHRANLAAALRLENEGLRARLEQRLSLAEIERYAAEELGMQHLGADQIVLVPAGK